MEHHPGIEELVEQRAFLERLAGGLFADDARAQDLVQDVQLRWLERPPASGESTRGWLATVARRLASNARRSQARRELHERAAARLEPLPADGDVVERIDLTRRVLAAVRELREPYRTAVWLRYWDELSPPEIAARESTPLATVKSRLRRGLAELRARLDAAHGGRRETWVLAWAGLLRRPATSATLTTTIGGTLAMKKLALAALVPLLVVFVWRATTREGSRGAAPESVEWSLAAPVAPEEAAPSAAPARRPVDASAPAASAAAGTTPPNASLAVRVVWHTGEPAPGIGVVAWPEDEPRPDLAALEAASDETGGIAYEALAPGRWVLHTDRGTVLALELAAGEHETAGLVLPTGVDVEGTVVDADGRAVGAAEIWLEGDGRGVLAGRVVARSDADGRFALRSVGPEQALGASIAGRAPSFVEDLGERAARPGADALVVTLRLGPPVDALAGRVLDPDGLPVADALVAVGADSSWVVRADGGLARRAKARVVRTGADGRFRSGWRVDALDPLHVLAAGFPIARVEPSAHGSDPIEVRLARGATLAGTVVDAAGEPLAGARITLLRAGPLVPTVCPFCLAEVRSDADGSFRMEALPPGELELHVRHPSDATQRIRASAFAPDGGVVGLELRLEARPTIGIAALDAAGEPLPGATIGVRAKDAFPLRSTDAEGRLVFAPEDPDSEWTIELLGAGGRLDRRSGVRPGDRVTLVAPPASAALVGRFRDAGGRAEPGVEVVASLEPEGGVAVALRSTIDERGTFEFPTVTPGRHRVSILWRGATIAASDWLEIAPGARVDLGLLESRAAGSLAVTCTAPAGAGLEPLSIVLTARDGSGSRLLHPDGGTWRASGLEPGRYRLLVNGFDVAERDVELEIAPGVELERTVALERGTTCSLRFDGPTDLRVEYELLDVDGVRVLGGVATVASTVRHALAPGAYRVEARAGAAGLSATGMLEVPDLSETRAELVLVLR